MVFGNPFFVEGTLSGTGAANHAIVLQANPFPYLGGFKTVGNPELTNSTGGFSFPYSACSKTLSCASSRSARTRGTSPVVIENVAVRAAFHVRSTRRHGFVRLYGTVAPAEVGAQVGFQLLSPATPRSTRAAPP